MVTCSGRGGCSLVLVMVEVRQGHKLISYYVEKQNLFTMKQI